MIDMDRVNQLTDELCAAQKRQAEIMEQLNKSLLIKSLWPGAFDRGSATTVWRMPLQTVFEYDMAIRRGRDPLEGAVFKVKRPDGETREFPYKDVPALLRTAQRRVER